MILSHMNWHALLCLGTFTFLSADIAAQIIDQSQPTFTRTDDIASSGKSGQTFTAGVTAPLTGIRLVVEGIGFSGNPVFGSDFVLSLQSTAGGTPTGNLLALGSFSKITIQRDVPQWITVAFNTPYQQSAGEVLAFTIQELSGGGANGFNNYGNADGNLYPRGQMFFTFTSGQALTSSTRDFAFETLVIPEPTSFALLTLGAIGLVFLRMRCVRAATTPASNTQPRISASESGCNASAHRESKTAARLLGHFLRRSIAATFLAVLAVLAISQSLAGDWPMHRGGPLLQGRADEAAPAQAALRWTFKAGAPVKGGAAIVGGRVYFGDDNGAVHCVALADGAEAWTFKTEGSIEATPLLLDGLCYIGATDGFLYALDAATGALKWKHETGDKITGSANWTKAPDSDATGAAGAKWVVVGSQDFSLYALDAVTGKPVWKLETENFIVGTPAITGRGETVFGGCDAILHVVSVKDGKQVRQMEVDAYVQGSVAADGAMVYFGNHSNQVYAFDTATGASVWKYRARNFPYTASPAIDDEVVIIGGHDKRLHCIDRKTGDGRWVFPTRGHIESSPVLCKDGGIIFGSEDGSLYCVNKADGKERWAYEIGSPISGSPAVAGGAIVIGAEDGNVYCIGGK